MTEASPIASSGNAASLLLGRTMDSVPFSAYHLQLILVLGAVGFVEGYDLALGGSLLVLAKQPLHLTPEQIRWLAVAPILLVVVGAYTAAAISDRVSRKTVMRIGVVVSTFFTLLIPLAQSGTQLIIIRVLTGIGLGFALSAPFPIAAELMPAQHRRTYGAIYEVMLASAFTLLPFVGFVLADNPDGFRLIALPGGLALGVVPLLVHFGLPESPRWYLSRGNYPGGGRHRQSNDRPLRRPRPAADGRGARQRRANNARGAAFLLGAFPPRPAARDHRRHHLLRRRVHRLLLFRHPAAEGAGRPRRCGQLELWAQHAAVRDDHTRQILHRVHHGGHRTAVDDHLLPRRCNSRPSADGPGAPDRGILHSRDDCRSDDHWPDRAVVLPGGAGLPLRAVPDHAARTWALFWGGDRAALCRRADTLPAGTVYQFRNDILRDDRRGCGDRCLCPGAVRQGNRRPAGDGRRGVPELGKA